MFVSLSTSSLSKLKSQSRRSSCPICTAVVEPEDSFAMETPLTPVQLILFDNEKNYSSAKNSVQFSESALLESRSAQIATCCCHILLSTFQPLPACFNFPPVATFLPACFFATASPTPPFQRWSIRCNVGGEGDRRAAWTYIKYY